MRSFPSEKTERVLAECKKIIPGKLSCPHDAVSPEKNENHQQNGENNHTEAWSEEWYRHPKQIQWFVKDTQEFKPGRNKNSTNHAAGNATHTTKDDNQKEVISQSEQEVLRINRA